MGVVVGTFDQLVHMRICTPGASTLTECVDIFNCGDIWLYCLDWYYTCITEICVMWVFNIFCLL